MNILNAIMLFLIAVYIMQGLYKGFLVSVGNTIGMAVSWLVGFLLGPTLAGAIAEGDFYTFLLNLTEGSSRLVNQADGNLVVSSLSQSQIHSIVDSSAANLPYPFADLIESNMDGLVFQNQSLSTVTDYFNYTVTNVVVNIFAFVIIYLLARVIISLLINAVNFASPLPVLRRFDELAGGGVGALRGFMAMFVFTMLVPVILISMPTTVDVFSNMFAESSMVTYFYDHNFLLGFISGVIP